jgi:hypothetical protein
VAIEVSVGAARQRYLLPRAGAPVGSGMRQGTLAASCTAMRLLLEPAGSGAGDAAVPPADASVDDPRDLAPLPPGDAAGDDPADLAVAAPADLAVPWPPADLAQPPVYDLAKPPIYDLSKPPIYDLAQPVHDLAVKTPGIGFNGESDTALFPSHADGTLYRDGCPAGQAIIGFQLQVPYDSSNQMAAVYRVDPICALPSVSSTGGGGWTVGATRTIVVPGHGVAAVQTIEFVCPTNHFIAGFAGRSGDYMDQLSLVCGPIAVSSNGSVTVGPVFTTTNHIGGNGGNPFGPVYCPSGQVATLVRVYVPTGYPFVGFGLGCSTVVSQ